MKNLTLSVVGRRARDGFCRCGSGASSGASSSCSGSRDDGCGGGACRSIDLAAAKRASVSKLIRLLGEEVACDDKVLFDHCVVSRGRRNASANIFCGLPSKGLRRLFAVYGIDEVQTKAPHRSLDLDEEARRERQATRRHRDPSRAEANQRQHRARSALDPSRRRQLPAFAADSAPASGSERHSHVC